jgi:hypothetical protein
MFWIHNIPLHNHGTGAHITIVDCFQKYGFNLSQTNDSEDATELSIARDDWGQLKAGIITRICIL